MSRDAGWSAMSARRGHPGRQPKRKDAVLRWIHSAFSIADGKGRPHYQTEGDCQHVVAADPPAPISCGRSPWIAWCNRVGGHWKTWGTDRPSASGRAGFGRGWASGPFVRPGGAFSGDRERVIFRGPPIRSEGPAHEHPIRRRLRAFPPRPGGVLGRGGRGGRVAPALGPGARRPPGAVLPLVRRGPEVNTCHNAVDVHVEAGPRRAAGPHPRQPDHRPQDVPHLRRAPGRDRAPRRRPRPARGRARRPGDHLHADGARGGGRDARLRAPRGGAQRRLRRLRGEGARGAHRRLRAQGDPQRLVRHRAGARRRVQAPPRRRARALAPPPGPLRHPPAPRAPVRARPGPRPSTGGDCLAGARAARVRAGRGHRPPRTSSTPPAPPGSRRGWCATTAGTSWPSSGR